MPLTIKGPSARNAGETTTVTSAGRASTAATAAEAPYVTSSRTRWSGECEWPIQSGRRRTGIPVPNLAIGPQPVRPDVRTGVRGALRPPRRGASFAASSRAHSDAIGPIAVGSGSSYQLQS